MPSTTAVVIAAVICYAIITISVFSSNLSDGLRLKNYPNTAMHHIECELRRKGIQADPEVVLLERIREHHRKARLCWAWPVLAVVFLRDAMSSLNEK